MAACGQIVDDSRGSGIQYRFMNPADEEESKKERLTSARFSVDDLDMPEKMILQVRVLEAAGLGRQTNFALKRVTIPWPSCSVQIVNARGSTTTKKAYKTNVVKSTAFPLWDETWSFNIHDDDYESDEAAFRFQIRNEKRGSQDLGAVVVPLKQTVTSCFQSQDRCFNNWFQLQNGSIKGAGKLFVAFKLVEKEKLNKKIIPALKNIESKEEDVGIYIGTMNCGNAQPPDNLEDWLHPDIRRHQLVVVGCQECDWKDEKEEEQIWEDAILKAINNFQRANVKNVYVCLTRRSLTEMRIFCFVDQNSLDNQKISHMATFHEATGIGGVYGNKGGTLISLDYGGTSFCFANCHLAAHQKKEHWDRRNADYKEICTSSQLGNIKHDMLEQFHHVFWMGDLNYRCDYNQMEEPQNTPSEELFKEYVSNIENNDFHKMLKGDQLIRSRDIEKPTAFFGFLEGDINFKPTFKVYVDKPYEYQPKRSPAWCDRIMWKSAPCFEKDVTCDHYNNAPKVCSSDHKPVFGEFTVRTWERAPGNIDDGVTKKKPSATMEFRNVQAMGLRSADLISMSDPYLHFPRQELLGKYQKSARVKSSNDPNWADNALPRLNLIRTNVAFLQNALLLVQCRDYDRFSRADKLASTYLPLAPLVDEKGKWIKFDRNMSFEGLQGGVLRGEYRLLLE